MNNTWIKYILVFTLIILIQGLVLNPMEISEYVNPMVYPMLILMLPFEAGTLVTIFVALLLGIAVDGFSDTFGLHASASMLIGYLRPTLLKYIKPRDGYESGFFPSIQDMGFTWFFGYSLLFISIHHLWFFSIEVFRFDLIGLILLKTAGSVFASLSLIILLQYILYTSSKK